MKKALIIGSTVVDVIIRVDHLPKTAQDVHVLEQHMSLGGCAFNTSDTVRHFSIPYILFSPVGTGAYGQFVRDALQSLSVSTPIPTPMKDNGCCYCFIEDSGERTFLSYHGAEYLFEPQWFDLIDDTEIDSVYLCGLEVEETTGDTILDYLEQHPSYHLYFAPGPRICRIEPRKMSRIMALHPILHLNRDEALSYTLADSVEDAAAILHTRFQNDSIITLGSGGAYYMTDHEQGYIASTPVQQIDTIGAGDSHIGSIIACRMRGDSLPEAIRKANLVSGAVVQTSGALLDDAVFASLSL